MEKEEKELTWMERAERRFIEKGWKKGNKTGSFVHIIVKHENKTTKLTDMAENITKILMDLFRGKSVNYSRKTGVGNINKLGELKVRPERLAVEFPPRFSNRCKANKWEQALRAHEQCLKALDKEIVCSRFSFGENPLGSVVVNLGSLSGRIEAVDYFFDYKKSDEQTTRWYLNFADPDLFYAYGGSLFAQDEIQTLEHPLLGALRECLVNEYFEGLQPMASCYGKPTPVLIQNVPYQIAVDTAPTLPDGTAVSIYGNRFRMWEYDNPQVLDFAIRIREEVGLSNIIAMSAPTQRYGFYTAETIAEMLETTYVAFGAAASLLETPATEIHTGRWGAGAFGGSEELAIVVQIVGALAAGIDKIIFHAVSERCLEQAQQAVGEMIAFLGSATSFDSVVNFLLERKYQWGKSDGN